MSLWIKLPIKPAWPFSSSNLYLPWLTQLRREISKFPTPSNWQAGCFFSSFSASIPLVIFKWILLGSWEGNIQGDLLFCWIVGVFRCLSFWNGMRICLNKLRKMITNESRIAPAKDFFDWGKRSKTHNNGKWEQNGDLKYKKYSHCTTW